jgi:hypothetical protein
LKTKDHLSHSTRHRIAALSRTFKTLGKFSLPKSSDIYASTELLNIPGQVDSNVSEIGAQQIANMKEKLHRLAFGWWPFRRCCEPGKPVKACLDA